MSRGRPTPIAATEWRAHPWLGRGVRAFAYAAPILVALLVSLELSRHLPRSGAFGNGLVWWLCVTATPMAVVAVLERAARRLLPLAALLSLAMVFPDQAPRRFRVARQVGRPADLRRRLEEARAQGISGVSTTSLQTVLELASALSVHDKRTRGHSERVRVFTDMIAAEMRLSLEDRSKLRWASLLHDIGKLRVSHDILNKPGVPNEEEWEELRRHPDEGARLVGPIVEWLGEWGAAIAHHHERWDGKGYPRGLAAEQISLGGRIVAVADSYETMTATRSYKRPMRPAEARRELVACAGSQFDPAVVRAFLQISMGRVTRAVGLSGWVAQVPGLLRLGPLLGQAGSTAASAAAAAAAAVAIGAGGLHAAASVVASPPSATPVPAPSATDAGALQSSGPLPSARVTVAATPQPHPTGGRGAHGSGQSPHAAPSPAGGGGSAGQGNGGATPTRPPTAGPKTTGPQGG